MPYPWSAGNVLTATDLNSSLAAKAPSASPTFTGTATFTGATVVGLTNGFYPLVHIREQQAQNTASGTFTSGAWRTRLLNTAKTTNIVGASLASNQVTLPIGTYFVMASANVGVNVGVHQTRVQNITGAATLLTGTVLRAPTAGSGASGSGPSLCNGFFTLASISAIELQHQCSVTEATVGFGYQGNFTTEVYSEIMIWKV